jgi:cytochrome P450
VTSTQLAGEPLAWDPFDARFKADPHVVWRRLRDEAPVYYNAAHDFYALSRFVDVDAASRDSATFSSAHGTVLEMMTPDFIGGDLMIFMDPPDHTRHAAPGLQGVHAPAHRRPRRRHPFPVCVAPRCAARVKRVRLRAGLRGPGPAYVIAALLGVPRTTATTCVGSSTPRSTSTPRRG